MKQFSIRQYVAWLTMAPLLVMAASLETYFLHEHYSDLDHELIERGQLITRQLASSGEYGVFANNQIFLQSIAQNVLQQPDVRGVMILNAASAVLVEAGTFTGTQGVSASGRDAEKTLPANFRMPLYQNSGAVRIFQPIIATQVALDELDSPHGAKQIGAVIVEMSRARTEQLKSQMFWWTLGATALFLLLPSGLIYLGSRNLISLVHGLSDAVRVIGEGSLDTRIAASAPVIELETLAHGINDMAAKLQQEHEMLRQRTDSLTEAQRIAHIGNWEWDIANNTLIWSDEIYRIFGLTPQQPAAAHDVFMQAVHPDDRRLVDSQVREALQQGQTYSLDHRILLPDGTLRHVHEHAEVLRGAEGQAIKMRGTTQDITKDKQAENMLRTSNRRFAAVLQAVPDLMFELDRNGKYLNVWGISGDLLAAPENQLLGRTVAEMLPAAAAQEVMAAIAEADAKGHSFGHQIELPLPQGDHWFELSAAKQMSDTTQESSFIMLSRDITDRKLAELRIGNLNEELEIKVRERTKQLLDAQEELVRKEKLAVLGQVAGSVGHELRNPLGVMSNSVYYLQTVLAGADDSVKEYLGIIKGEIVNSERIVADLLDSVRTQPPRVETVGVEELIGQVLRKYSVPPQVTVKLDIPATLSPLRVDAQQIHQVLRNLISNGVEAMPDGGTLEIGAVENKREGTLSVSVKDDGTGITPEQMGKLFQPLFTTKARGIGLGLVVVKNLTQANGGTVKVESEVGKGTLFSITLPSASSTLATA